MDVDQCYDIGSILKRLYFRPSFYEREFITFDSHVETKMRVYLYSIAICHQTHSLINRKMNLLGWDFMEFAYLNMVKADSELLDPGKLAEMSVDEVSVKIKPFFSDDGSPEKCTIDRLGERSEFLIDIGEKIRDHYGGRVRNLVCISDGYLLRDGKGLYELLEKFEAYKDPLRKKSGLFIKLMMDAGLVSVKDPENFIPVVDYHIQRVLLRMGCLEIVDRDLLNILKTREPLESDEEIRSKCVEAMNIISDVSGYQAVQMNDFFYPLGRSCCMEKMLCVDGECNKDPCSFDKVVELSFHEICIFEGTCKGSGDAEYRRFWQPVVETHYY
ncbi:MAG: hypothetical protein PVH79_01655 [Candidatus Bathyarchaeota archaeon]